MPLRQYVDDPLPEPADFVRHAGRHLADQAPPGWATRVLAEGRGVVLVDGVDELPPGRREDARRWLRDLLTDFPDCRYVVTARPGAAGEAWLDADGFTSAEIRPLRERDVRSFVHHWHEAVRGQTADEAERALLTRYQSELTRKVLGQRHLRAIASTPLLCALLCALYRDRHTSLPRDRMEVYEAALAMLLKDRDQQRGIEGIDLSRQELVLLHQELARWLVLNGSSDAPTATAQRQVTRVLAAMHRVSERPEEVFSHLVVRGGLLQCPAVDRVSFLHRTFEEYLAAKALVEEDSFPLLIKHAHDEQWHEVVVMAAGHATPAQREELIGGLLERSGRVKKHRDRLLLVAFACLETSPRLSPRLRDEVRDRVRSILPPRTEAHVHALALVGEYALPLLSEAPPKNARQAVKAIETASAIGGPRSVPIIEDALRFDSERVFLAAQQAWWKERTPDLARAFFPVAEKRRPHYYVPVTVDQIPLHSLHMPGNSRVSVEGGHGERVDELASMSGVTFVHLRNRDGEDWHGIDLAPLREIPLLDRVEVYGSASASSIAPLTGSPIEELDLSWPDRTLDLHLTRQFASLERLVLARSLPAVPFGDVVPETGLDALAFVRTGMPDLRYLTSRPDSVHRLTVLAAPGLEGLDGLESQGGTLTHLVIRENEGDQPVSFRPLAELAKVTALRVEGPSWSRPGNPAWITRMPELRHLHLGNHAAGRPTWVIAPWIADLPHLQDLYLQYAGHIDLTALAGVEDLTVHVSATQRVTGAHLLGTGSTLVKTDLLRFLRW
ncbi:NACHT domain-containing NTPase [Nocardiopsis sp. YSL2]|uniref:NACHT domain-containing protein n=1 Tax=Nocardiopsis sp. YSL2 TaxID=2939492 RepID=UPI00350E5257